MQNFLTKERKWISASARHMHTSPREGKTRILTLDPVTIEFKDLTVKLQTKEYFEEGSSNIRIERHILEMSDPTAEVTLNEYMVACYGTTEYSRICQTSP